MTRDHSHAVHVWLLLSNENKIQTLLLLFILSLVTHCITPIPLFSPINMADTRSKEGSFQWAIKTGDVKGVQEYIEKEKIDLNKPDTTVKKRTPLHYAADFGQGNY